MYRFGCTHLLRGVNQVEYTDTYNYTDICRSLTQDLLIYVGTQDLRMKCVVLLTIP